MKFTIIAVGKLKERFWKEIVDEYSKRVANLEVIEVADIGTRHVPSQKEIEQIKVREGKRILKVLPKKAYYFALCIEGAEMDSLEFSNYLKKLQMSHSHIVFIIGGSYGLSEEVLEKVQKKISFSRFTFPHQMVRGILIEQIYRAITIQNKVVYHK